MDIASAIGVGIVLVQTYDKRQMQLESCDLRNFTLIDQKLAVIDRELTVIVHAFESYELL